MYERHLSDEEKDGDATFEKLLDITEYPDLGGEKEKLDVTTLSDKRREPSTVLKIPEILISRHGTS